MSGKTIGGESFGDIESSQAVSEGSSRKRNSNHGSCMF